MKEEVEKQIKAGILIVIEYPEWVANAVTVPKKGECISGCVNFWNLDKASLKDDFPLVHIDVLVDNTARQELLLFMDGFLGYNQILMALKDREEPSSLRIGIPIATKSFL